MEFAFSMESVSRIHIKCQGEIVYGLSAADKKKKNKNNTIAAAVWVEIKIETVF